MSVVAATPFPTRAPSRSSSLSRAGYMFLAVFFILVFEGAIRKWVTSASTLPLILLRDLLALGLVLYAISTGAIKRQKGIVAALVVWSCIVLAWGLFQLVAGQSSPLVLIIGLRFWLLYTWFAVAAACAMNESDYRASLYAAIGMLLLMAPLAVLQHYSPPGARINTQIDGDGDEGVFVVVVGVVRTTGTFSFTSAYAVFLTLVAPAVFGFLSARKRGIKQLVFALAAFAAFAVGALVSGSRTAVISGGLLFITYLVGRLLFSKMKKKPAAAAAVAAAIVLFGLFALFFQEAIEVTQTRFEQASAAEDLGERIRTVLFGEAGAWAAAPWTGFGIGFGSNLATYVRTGSAEVFSLAETEGARILMEAGIVGFLYLSLKLVFLAWGTLKSVRVSARTNSPFPLIVWLSTAIAVATWPSIGQLSGNGLLGVMMAFALLLFRFPRLELFPPRASRT